MAPPAPDPRRLAEVEPAAHDDHDGDPAPDADPAPDDHIDPTPDHHLTPPPTTTTTSTPPPTTTTTSTPPPTTTTTSTPPPPTSPSVYWGANIGTQLTGGEPPWDWTAVNAFENTDGGGKTSSILHWGSMFYSSDYCAGACTFTTNIYQKVRDNGKIPFVSWSSQSSTGENGYTDAEIAAGSQDAYITKWAQAAKAWGHPFFLRFDWEMNASWFGWGVGANGNTAADYVAMWRHVHNIFTSVGANNVSWVWCPNIDDSPSFAPLASLYPGDAYVDWTCLDGYNGDVPWTSFHNLFLKSYNEIAGSIAPNKPMIIGEVGTTETRRVEGPVDHRHAERPSRQLPQDPRVPLVRRQPVRPGKPQRLADRLVELLRGGVRPGHRQPDVRGQVVLQPQHQPHPRHAVDSRAGRLRPAYAPDDGVGRSCCGPAMGPLRSTSSRYNASC